jgi:hypothetical protein
MSKNEKEQGMLEAKSSHQLCKNMYVCLGDVYSLLQLISSKYDGSY